MKTREEIFDGLEKAIREMEERNIGLTQPSWEAIILAAAYLEGKHNWIPVEEELPPKGMEVLAWGITIPVEKGKLSFCDIFYSWRMEHKPYFYDDVDENGFCLYSLGSRSDHRGFKITHWMPLPTAPRKEE